MAPTSSLNDSVPSRTAWGFQKVVASIQCSMCPYSAAATPSIRRPAPIFHLLPTTAPCYCNQRRLSTHDGPAADLGSWRRSSSNGSPSQPTTPLGNLLQYSTIGSSSSALRTMLLFQKRAMIGCLVVRQVHLISLADQLALIDPTHGSETSNQLAELLLALDWFLCCSLVPVSLL
ncbi:hypothetical protein LINGRAHAP2_LOCUS3930 [Linum grandiflorum]